MDPLEEYNFVHAVALSRSVSAFQQYVDTDVDVNALGKPEVVPQAMNAPEGTLENARSEVEQTESILLDLMRPFGWARSWRKRRRQQDRPRGLRWGSAFLLGLLIAGGTVAVIEYLTLGGLTLDVIAPRMQGRGEFAAAVLITGTVVIAGALALLLRIVSGRRT